MPGKASTLIISCMGASPDLVISPGPQFDEHISWNLEYDGVSYELGALLGQDILRAIPFSIREQIQMDWDGFWRLDNLTDQPHRFKLIPDSKPETVPGQGWTENQSFNVDEHGVIQFCLAPVITKIPQPEVPVVPSSSIIPTAIRWDKTLSGDGDEYRRLFPKDRVSMDIFHHPVCFILPTNATTQQTISFLTQEVNATADGKIFVGNDGLAFPLRTLNITQTDIERGYVRYDQYFKITNATVMQSGRIIVLAADGGGDSQDLIVQPQE